MEKRLREGAGFWNFVAAVTVLGALALLVVWNPLGAGLSPMQTATPQPTPAPVWDFELQDLEGDAVRLSDLRGSVVLVNFWASWCPPCRAEMPMLQDFYLAHRAEGFVLLGVNVSEDVDVAAQFVAGNDYRFPVWLDPPGNLLIEQRLSGLPASLLVDAEGRIVRRWIGPLAEEDLAEAVLPLLP